MIRSTWAGAPARLLLATILTLAVTMVAVGTPLSSAGAATNSPASQFVRFFPETGVSVGGAFLSFFDQYGGVRIFGYPITSEMSEGGMTVQYFERQRFEYHRDMAGTPYEVQLGNLGVEASQGKVSLARVAPVSATSTRTYFRETGHTLRGVFFTFWNANGGLRVMGFPISEPVSINGLLTQYFERARMEYHPEEVKTGFGVELGHLGKEYMAAHGIAGAAPPPPDASFSAQAKSLLSLINAGRQNAGLRHVTVDSQLTAIAQGRSNDMVARNYFSHITPEGKDYQTLLKAAGVRYRWSGEILNKNNFREDLAASSAYDWFLSSPAHHDIIFDGRYNLVGLGVTRDGAGYFVFTVIFTQSY